jgi:hypothetical protein
MTLREQQKLIRLLAVYYRTDHLVDIQPTNTPLTPIIPSLKPVSQRPIKMPAGQPQQQQQQQTQTPLVPQTPAAIQTAGTDKFGVPYNVALFLQ